MSMLGIRDLKTMAVTLEKWQYDFQAHFGTLKKNVEVDDHYSV